MNARKRKMRAKRYQASLGIEPLECRTLLASAPGLLLPLGGAIEFGVADAVAMPDSPTAANESNFAPPSRPTEGGEPGANGARPLPTGNLASAPDRSERLRRDRNQDSPTPPREAPPPPSLDGTDNNVQNSDWGSADTDLARLTSVEYGDGISEPAGADRPSAREISNAVSAQSESIPNDRGLTSFVWFWGQFIDHDIDLTHSGDSGESFPIEVPAGDPYFDPSGTGSVTIGLDRSDYDPSTGGSVDNPRQQVNAITAFIDGSVVYGSDQERAGALRTFEGGKLKTSEGDLLPFNEAGLDNACGTSESLFLAGDVRANENVALTAMQTLWVREHNRIADDIAAADPSLSDEQVYQQARRIVTAELQAITYNEFLPALLGADAISPYSGYDPSVNPGIANIFSTAIYRFGHSMLTPELLRLSNDGSVIGAGNLSLRDAFFAPDEIVAHDIDSLLLGGASQLALEIDTQVVDDVRNFLFGPPGAGGFDLASLNIQRGRDHGLPDYNQVRVDMGLEPVNSVAEITSDPQLQAALEEVYGDVNNIDVWVGTLAEDHVSGASVGELSYTVMVDQFERIRDGDRFWYQQTFRGRELRAIENTTLADVILRNTDVTEIQDNVFFAQSMPEGQLARGGPRAPVDLAGLDGSGLQAGPNTGGVDVADGADTPRGADGPRDSRVARAPIDAPSRPAGPERQGARPASDDDNAEERRSRRDTELRIRDLAFAELGSMDLP